MAGCCKLLWVKCWVLWNPAILPEINHFCLTSSVAEEDSNFQAMLRSNPEDAQANFGKMESLLTNNMEPQPIGLEDGLDKN